MKPIRHRFALSLALAVLSTGVLADQRGGRGTAPLPPVRACDLLTKDVVAAHTPASPESFKLMASLPPDDSPTAPRGTSCTYGGVTLQIDSYSPATIDSIGKGKDMTPIPNLGDAAFYRPNRSYFLELATRSGGRVVMIQMNVPDGKTPQQIVPNAIGLAKAILSKLK